MFEFCIPTIQDYGAALKLNDWEKFRICYDRLFLFFSMCTTKGVADYQRTMYVHMILMDYWKEQKLPVFEMLRKNSTFFSEESGEIALSMLVNMQPVGTGAELPVARRYWQCLPLRERSFSILDTPRNKKYRLISIFFYSLLCLRRENRLIILVCVEPEDKAVEIIVNHLEKTINAIVAGTWRHVVPKPMKKRGRKKKSEKSLDEKEEQLPEIKQTHASDQKQYFAKMGYDTKVIPFLVGPVKLQKNLDKIRKMLVDSLKKFNYAKTTPLLTAHLGPAYVGVADSGIDHLVAPPQRGRPRKRPVSPPQDGVVSNIERVSYVNIHYLDRYFIKQSR